MGIQDLSTPFVRDNKDATNAKLKDLVSESPHPVVIGIDISVTIITSISTAGPNVIAKYHCIPQIPLDEITEKVIASIKKFFKFGVDKAILVFDGRTPQPKKDNAHVNRYKNVPKNKSELENLYKIKEFANDEEEKKHLAKVAKLRKKLSPIRPDMIYYIIEAISKSDMLKGRVSFCGAPYEADHQLVSLFNQKIIDYAITTDSDLVCMGVDVIIASSVNSSTGKCWKMTLATLLQRMSEKTQKKGKKYTWTKNILHHVACLLGNDYIRRISGNSVAKITDFVRDIDGLDEDSIYKHIYDVRTKVTSGKKADREIWNTNEVKRRDHLKLWRQAKSMFQHGPVFLLHPTSDSATPRQAMFERKYNISLGSLQGTSDVQWVHPESHELLVGFNPKEEFRDLMDCIEPVVDYSNTEEKMTALMKECFDLQRWSRTGELLKGLKVPTDSNGNELYFGSMIDFEKIPPLYHSADILKFYLESRQVKCPARLTEIRYLVGKIYDSHGDKLRPIPKILMRGVSGWIKEEVLRIREGKTEIEWLTKDALLDSLQVSFPNLTENNFATHFGKRNGTRLRLLKHIQGGSFDIANIRATYDMVHKLQIDQSLFIIEASCAPSQKLKDGSKDAFHNIRLCLEIDSENKSFKKFLPHPSTICECPNGCISCAHIGGGIGYCIGVKELYQVLKKRKLEALNVNESGDTSTSSTDNCDETILSFEELKNHLPQPVHELVKTPVPTSYAFPEPGSKKKLNQNQYRRTKGMNRKKKGPGRARKTKIKNRNNASKPTSENTGNQNVDDAEVNDGPASILQTQTHRVAAEAAIEAEVDDPLTDLKEYWEECELAIDGIMDNSVQNVVPVITNIKEWTTYLTDGRDEKGHDLHTIKEINEHTKEMADHESTDVYLATQCKVLLAAEKMLERQKERNAKWRNDNTDKEHSKFAPVDSGMLPVLKVIRNNIDKKVIELAGKFSDDELNLSKLVPKNW